jgi:hypothetical protein
MSWHDAGFKEPSRGAQMGKEAAAFSESSRRLEGDKPVVKRGSASENHRIEETKHPNPGERPEGREKGATWPWR